MSKMLQLDPMIPMVIRETGEKATAILVLDYSQEHEALFLVWAHDRREMWILPHTALGLDANISLGRESKR